MFFLTYEYAKAVLRAATPTGSDDGSNHYHLAHVGAASMAEFVRECKKKKKKNDN
jgi:hypothetical protein